jgi:hypothetical protein
VFGPKGGRRESVTWLDYRLLEFAERLPLALDARARLPEQPQNDQYEDDDEQDMNEISGLRNPWDPRRPEISQEPEDDENDDEKFEHESFLSLFGDPTPRRSTSYRSLIAHLPSV